MSAIKLLRNEGNEFPISYFFNNFHFIKKIKETACRSAVSLKGEGIFYYGGSKKLIMYWGFYSYYNSKCVHVSVHNHS